MDGLPPSDRPIPNRHQRSRTASRLPQVRLTAFSEEDEIAGDRVLSRASSPEVQPAKKSYSAGAFLVVRLLLGVGLIGTAAYYNVKLGVYPNRPSTVSPGLPSPPLAASQKPAGNEAIAVAGYPQRPVEPSTMAWGSAAHGPLQSNLPVDRARSATPAKAAVHLVVPVPPAAPVVAAVPPAVAVALPPFPAAQAVVVPPVERAEPPAAKATAPAVAVIAPSVPPDVAVILPPFPAARAVVAPPAAKAIPPAAMATAPAVALHAPLIVPAEPPVAPPVPPAVAVVLPPFPAAGAVVAAPPAARALVAPPVARAEPPAAKATVPAVALHAPLIVPAEPPAAPPVPPAVAVILPPFPAARAVVAPPAARAEPPAAMAAAPAVALRAPLMVPAEAPVAPPIAPVVTVVAPLAAKSKLAAVSPLVPAVAVVGPSLPDALPTDTGLHLRIVYTPSDPAEETQIDALTQRLRGENSDIASTVAAPGPAAEGGVLYFFPNDRAGAGRVAASLAGMTKRPEPVVLVHANPLPRPGTVEIRLSPRFAKDLNP